MILDDLDNAPRYVALHPGFAAAFDYLRTADIRSLPQGRADVDGERLFAVIGREPGQGREKRKLEFHRRYIDIQCVLSGEDEIGWRPESRCRTLVEPYDPAREVGFYGDASESYFRLGARQFVIFWPSDCHAPLSGRGEMVKAVMKVAVDWK